MQHRSAFALLALFVLALTIACGGSAATTPAAPEPAAPVAADTAVSGATAAPEPLADTPVPIAAAQYLGDAVDGAGFGLAAVAVQDPATPGMFYEPEPGTRLVAVEVIVANTADEVQTVNLLSAAVVDADGFVVTPELASVDNQLATVALLPGQKVRGMVGFTLPENAVPVALKWTPNMFSGSSISASLAPPPDGHTADNAAIAIPAPAIDTPLGQEAQDFGVGLTAVTLEDPATPGMFYDAEPGTRLVAVEIIVSNAGAEAVSVNPLYTSLVDADGFVYEAELAGRDGQIDTMELAPGERVRGWVAFTIPEGAQPAGIRWNTLLSDNILQVSVQ